MIQFKRGSTESWKKLKKPLAAGQPGYDKDKHKIKVGDGEKLWDKLPYASISEEEVLDSEKNAKVRRKEDPESLAIMTYGTEGPDKNTVGKLYLQYYDAEPEVDYVVEYGVDGIWSYRKWHSGRAECCGTVTVQATVQTAVGALYSDSKNMKKIDYPFAFIAQPSNPEKVTPNEMASIQGPGDLVWLAARESNSKTHTAAYSILSPNKQQSAAKYEVTIRAEGFWR